MGKQAIPLGPAFSPPGIGHEARHSRAKTSPVEWETSWGGDPTGNTPGPYQSPSERGASPIYVNPGTLFDPPLASWQPRASLYPHSPYLRSYPPGVTPRPPCHRPSLLGRHTTPQCGPWTLRPTTGLGPSVSRSPRGPAPGSPLLFSGPPCSPLRCPPPSLSPPLP